MDDGRLDCDFDKPHVAIHLVEQTRHALLKHVKLLVDEDSSYLRQSRCHVLCIVTLLQPSYEPRWHDDVIIPRMRQSTTNVVVNENQSPSNPWITWKLVTNQLVDLPQ